MVSAMKKSARRLSSSLATSSLRIVSACTVIYLIACVGCASYQRRFIYFPPRFQISQVDELAQSNGLERWKNSSGEAIGLKRLSAGQPAKGSVLIFYGNGSCAAGCAHYADVIQEVAPLDVFILEYPGYADRAGKPTQKTIFAAADQALQSLGTNAPIYVLGESLGTGVACYLAGTYSNQIAGLVLLAPYNTLTDVAQSHMKLLPVSWFLIDRFPSEDYLKHYHGPVVMSVAGRDQVVPQRFGRLLYDPYKGPKALLEFPEADHGTVMAQPPEVWKRIIEFVQTNSISSVRP
jgi:uncharacterized protein